MRLTFEFGQRHPPGALEGDDDVGPHAVLEVLELARRSTPPTPMAPGSRGPVCVRAAFLLDAVRSPIGRKNGTLSVSRGDDLAAQVLNGLIARHDLDPIEIEDVQMGCVTQIG